jgi:hypothetical protein
MSEDDVGRFGGTRKGERFPLNTLGLGLFEILDKPGSTNTMLCIRNA